MNEQINITSAETLIYPEQELTGAILKAAFTVHNTLGVGFLEKVYANALSLELRAANITCEQELPLKVRYRNVIIGEYVAARGQKGARRTEGMCRFGPSSRSAVVELPSHWPNPRWAATKFWPTKTSLQTVHLLAASWATSLF